MAKRRRRHHRHHRRHSSSLALRGLGGGLGEELQITSTNFLAGAIAGGALAWFMINGSFSASTNAGY